MSIFHVAIDGPVASGKGTVARELSHRLGIPCLDTGAIYRGLAILEKIPPFVKGVPHEVGRGLSVAIVNDVTRVSIDGVDITERLRDNEISMLASKISTRPEVRAFCTAKAQEIAKTQSLIMEGRDICWNVLPNARFKFYLTGDVVVRAKRRLAELHAKGQQITLEELVSQVKARDENDMTRGGLRQTPDAIVVDSTNMTVDEVAEYMLNIINVHNCNRRPDGKR